MNVVVCQLMMYVIVGITISHGSVSVQSVKIGIDTHPIDLIAAEKFEKKITHRKRKYQWRTTLQSHSQSPPAFWSAPRHGALGHTAVK